ncbi:hypothetical protein EDD11_000541 [Mortierella claussenii]|nr:hypothetical protein EDD11_000541 [Mortierella claussenii]
MGNGSEAQKGRFRLTEDHLIKLEASFQVSAYPEKSVKNVLAEYVGCTEKQIANWFDRRRIAEKKGKSLLKGIPAVNSNSNSNNSRNRKTNTNINANINANISTNINVSAITNTNIKTNTNTNISFNNNTTIQPLLHAAVAVRLARLTQGNMIRKTENVPGIYELMKVASDHKGRLYILNALMSSKKISPVLSEFVLLGGHGILSDWMREAQEGSKSSDNMDMLCKAIDILNDLPLGTKDFTVNDLGKVMNRVAINKKQVIDQGIAEKASRVVKKWKRLVAEDGRSDSPAGSKTEGEKQTKKRPREGEDERFPGAREQPNVTPLPKFNKSKVAPSVETIKKSSATGNASFFDQLRGESTKSPSRATVQPSLTVKLKADASMERASSPGVSTTPTTPTTPIVSQANAAPIIPSMLALSTSAALPVSMPSNDNDIAPSSPPKAPGPPIRATSTSPPISVQDTYEAIADMVSSPPKKSKGRRVTWKADWELVSIRLIEPRGEHEGSEYDEHDMMDMEQDYGSEYDPEGLHYSTQTLAGHARPQFMMTQQRIDALVRGDHWRVPLQLQLESFGRPDRGIKSTENAKQEAREAETLSANYLQTAYIPASPAEPDPDPEQIQAEAATSTTGVSPAAAAFINSNTAAVLAALSATVAAAARPTATDTASHATTQAPSYDSFGAMYGTQQPHAGYSQVYQQPSYQQATIPGQAQAAPLGAAVTNDAAERTRQLLAMLQQTTQQTVTQEQEQLSQQQLAYQQQQTYYAAYHQTYQQQQPQQQQPQQPIQQPAAFDFSAFMQNYQPK